MIRAARFPFCILQQHLLSIILLKLIFTRLPSFYVLSEDAISNVGRIGDDIMPQTAPIYNSPPIKRIGDTAGSQSRIIKVFLRHITSHKQATMVSGTSKFNMHSRVLASLTIACYHPMFLLVYTRE